MDEWQQEMSAVEFESWLKYCAKKPLPAQRADLRTARQTTEIAGMMGAKDIKLTDFMFNFDDLDENADNGTGRQMSQQQVSHLLNVAVAQHIQDGYGEMVDGDRDDP